MMHRPILPPPIREMFRSEEQYLNARNAHIRDTKARIEEGKLEFAMMIVLMGVVVVVLAFMAFAMFGWFVTLCIGVALLAYYAAVKIVARFL